jgi:hypothetical protein
MTQAYQPSPDPIQTFATERLAAWRRWKTRAMVAGSAAAFVAFFVALHVLVEYSSFAVLLSLAPAAAAFWFTATVLMRLSPSPSLRCPYCAGQVPLLAPTPLGTPLEIMRMCPHCLGSL